MLEEQHEGLSKPSTDTNAYTLGSIGHHNIVIACLPRGHVGPNSAATVATQMIQTFPSIKIGLMVGIGGGMPPKVRLGDVVVSTPGDQYPGVVQWDLGKSMERGEFERTGSLNNPPNSLLSALGKLESKHELQGSQIPALLEQFGNDYPRAARNYLKSTSLKDILFKSSYLHIQRKSKGDDVDDTTEDSDDYESGEEQGCASCDASQIGRRKPQTRAFRIHYGLIASSNTIIEGAEFRDKLNKQLGGKVLCVETEAAGLMNSFPCIVIRGICDYADSHKNNSWQKHAAAVAAAFAKELLGCVQSSDVEGERPIRDIIADLKDELTHMSQDMKAGFGNANKRLDNLDEAQKTQARNEALTWLSPIDSASMHYDYIKKCEPGTGQSLLTSDELHHWLNTPQTTLFCPGIPGAGKTFQTAILVDHLINRFDRQDIQKPEQVIASLIKQLTQKHESLLEMMVEFHAKHMKRASRPLFQGLVTLFNAIIPLLSRAYIIIDALDECDDNDYGRTKLLNTLFAAKKVGLSIYATSREIDIIEQRFKGDLSRQIRPSTHDIFSFLDARMSQLPEFVQKSIALQDEIKQSIESAMEGMFLLAQLYIDSLAGKRSAASVRMALARLKNSSKGLKSRSIVLGKAYHKAMERIHRQKGDLPTDAMIILAWVVKSRKPLPVDALQLLLAIDIETSTIGKDNFPTAEHITQACAPLVVIESETHTARLAHYTIQEYFEESNNIWMEKSQTMIASICMSYLSFAKIQSVFGVNKFDHSHGEEFFHPYATEFWAHHAAEALVQGLDIQKILNFLDKKAKPDLWHDSLMQIDLEQKGEGKNKLETSEQVVALHVAACLGLPSVVKYLIAKESNPDVRDRQCRSPLWWAAINGHAEVVEIILKERGIDIEVKDNIYSHTPLRLAVDRGTLSVVKLLLDKGAGVESGNRELSSRWRKGTTISPNYFLTKGIRYSALHIAYNNRLYDMLKLLLEKGADANVQDGMGCTVLHYAASLGQSIVVQLLLANGADIRARTEHGMTALHFASHLNQREVERLFTKGADIKTQNGKSMTTLHFAAGSDMNTFELLLKNGADINAQNEQGMTALHYAIRFQTDSVELLLAKGSDIEAQDGEGMTALHLAVMPQPNKDSYTTIKLLIAHGANLEAKNKLGKTPLIIASKRADVAAHDDAGQSVFSLELLIAKGFTTEGGEAIMKSTILVDWLLKYNVDVNYRDDRHGSDISKSTFSWTPLHQAAKSGCAAIVSRLIEVDGIDIEAKVINGYASDAFMIAIRNGKREVARLLFDTGKVRPAPGQERFFEFVKRSYLKVSDDLIP
ncbi:ankyrin repeat-containing domain protein [Trichoderma barbatum]